MAEISVVGAGLAGCEAAVYLAKAGHKVRLLDIKPQKFTPAHSDKNFAELVCSNSLKGADMYTNACGLLKQEMREMGSVTMEAAEETKVPAGGALAVDRERFAAYITDRVNSYKNIAVECAEVTKIPASPAIVATGPLTCSSLAEDIKARFGGSLHFYDASAPIVLKESIDMSRAFVGDRYGRGSDDYINCPLSKEEYELFVNELTNAERAVLHTFERGEIFEGCMPVEVMAARGKDALRFGPLKPVGLRDKDGNAFYAVLQLRKENLSGDMYNLVGCQTNLKFGEQRRVFGIIPALRQAEFARYGVMHRNTFLHSPEILNADFSVKGEPLLFFAGQMTGVEGYVESAASGLLAAAHMARKLKGLPAVSPPVTTVCGALSSYIAAPNADFQPMNANFGVLPPLDTRIRDKKLRYAALADRAITDMKEYVKKLRRIK